VNTALDRNKIGVQKFLMIRDHFSPPWRFINILIIPYLIMISSSLILIVKKKKIISKFRWHLMKWILILNCVIFINYFERIYIASIQQKMYVISKLLTFNGVNKTIKMCYFYKQLKNYPYFKCNLYNLKYLLKLIYFIHVFLTSGIGIIYNFCYF
jgi:hypothetical protein